MALLQTLGTGTGYLKAGLLGFPKSGKTYTAVLLAAGTRKTLDLKGPIAFFDTEGGAEYVAPLVRTLTGLDPVGVRSRSFDDLLAVAKEAEAGGASVLVVDSITHVWRELMDAYLKQVNEARRAHGRPPRTALEFADWNPIKAKWSKWTDFYLNSRLHIVICGRAGFEWDFETDPDTGKKQLLKVGVKMKVESEFGFEPSLLVHMEREQVQVDGKFRLVHRATVHGDRFNVMDGAEADNPDFSFFEPHVACLKANAHAPIDTAVKSDLGVDQDGDAEWARERKERTILTEKIQGEMLRAWPGQTAAEKKAKVECIEAAFGTRSWTEVENTRSDRLKAGLQTIQSIVAEATRSPAGKEKE